MMRLTRKEFLAGLGAGVLLSARGAWAQQGTCKISVSIRPCVEGLHLNQKWLEHGELPGPTSGYENDLLPLGPKLCKHMKRQLSIHQILEGTGDTSIVDRSGIDYDICLSKLWIKDLHIVFLAAFSRILEPTAHISIAGSDLELPRIE